MFSKQRNNHMKKFLWVIEDQAMENIETKEKGLK